MKKKNYCNEVFERIRNFFLVKRYPFLKPSCGWRVSMQYHRAGYRYHYEETWLDNVPAGWYKLSLELCKELKKIIKEDHLKDYAIHQVKEKWGELCWYDEGGNKRTNELIRKYEKLSRDTCFYCGKTPTTHVTKGWITYICQDCVDKYYKDKSEKVKLKKEPVWQEITCPEKYK